MSEPTRLGKYLLLERTNTGNVAEVFIAKELGGVQGFERIVALKRVMPSLSLDRDFIEAFLDEARISVQLSHANIVHIIEVGHEDDTYFLAMEYVSGQSLGAVLEYFRRQRQPLPIPQAVFIATKLCEGLDYAHRRKDSRGKGLGIVHRGVSPRNVLLSYDGEVKLIDFGIAKAANRAQRTQVGTLKGTVGYMSPEQLRGQPPDRRTDIFAVGLLLFEMLTGEHPFTGETDQEVATRVLNGETPPLRGFNPYIPDGLEEIVLKALAREPEQRYLWASDLQEDLERFLISGESLYSSKHLAEFMREAFAGPMQQETERLQGLSGGESEEEPADVLATTPGTPHQLPGEESQDEEAPQLAPSDKTQVVLLEEAALPSVVVEDERDTRSKGGETVVATPPRSAGRRSSLRSTQAAPPKSTGELPPAPDRPSGERPRTTGDVPTAPGKASAAERPRPSRQRSRTSGERPRHMDQPAASEETIAGVRAPPEPSPPAQDGGYPQLPAPRSRPRTKVLSSPLASSEESPSRPIPKRTLPLARPRSRRPRWLAFVAAGASGLICVLLALILAHEKGMATIRVRVQPSADARVTIGGRLVANDRALKFPPGEYDLVAVAPGYKRQAQRITIWRTEGESAITIILEPSPTTPAEPPEPAKPAAAATPEQSP